MSKTISYNKFVRNTIFISVFIIVILFLLYGKYIQSSSIEKSIQNDAKVVSNLIFQNLYTVMKHGGNKKLIDDTISDIQNNLKDIKVQIVKKDVLNDELASSVFETKEIEVSKHGNHIDIISPIIYKNECLACHSNATVGNVAAVILIEYPILSLKISLKEIILMASILFVLMISVFFSIWYYFLRKYFVMPIKNLISQIKSITSHEDLEKEISIDTSIKEFKQLENSFNQQNKEIINSYKELELISNTDTLTGVLNRKRFSEYSSIFINNSKRYNTKFSLVVIDLNKFKFINDNYGHDVGDEILVLFTKIVSHLIRESDYLFRTGGDEFIILLSNTNLDEARNVVKKIKEALIKEPYYKDTLLFKISASFGIAEFGSDGDNIGTLVKVADERMYKYKKDITS